MNGIPQPRNRDDFNVQDHHNDVTRPRHFDFNRYNYDLGGNDVFWRRSEVPGVRNLNILPSEIRRFPCYINYRFCTHCICHNDAGLNPIRWRPRLANERVSSLREIRPVGRLQPLGFDSTKVSYSSDYLSRPPGPDVHTIAQQTPAIPRPFTVRPWLYWRDRFLTNWDDVTVANQVRMQQKINDDRSAIANYQHRQHSSSNDDEEFCSNKSECGSSHHGNLDSETEYELILSNRQTKGNKNEDLADSPCAYECRDDNRGINKESSPPTTTAGDEEDFSSNKSQRGSSHLDNLDSETEWDFIPETGPSSYHTDCKTTEEEHPPPANEVNDDDISSDKSVSSQPGKPESDLEWDFSTSTVDCSTNETSSRCAENECTVNLQKASPSPGMVCQDQIDPRLDDIKQSHKDNEPRNSPSPLYILKRHYNPRCKEPTYAVLKYEHPHFDGEFAPYRYDTWARVKPREKETDSVLDASAESPNSSEECSTPSEVVFQSVHTSSGGGHGVFSDAHPHDADESVQKHMELKRGNCNEDVDEVVFEKTKLTVLEDNWCGPDGTTLEQMAKNVPFFHLGRTAEETENRVSGKVDKSTMVQMKCQHSPQAPQRRDRICNGCSLHSEMNIQRMSNYVIIGDYLRKLYIHDQLCDVVIHVGSYTFSAHRLALAAHSTYFAEMFLANYKEPPAEIWLDDHGITASAFQTVLEHIYLAETKLTLENIGEVYTAAKLLQIQALQSLCEDLQDQFTPDNALIVLDLSGSNNTGNVAYQRALSVVTSSFHDVRQSGTFLALEAERICEILGSDDLAVISEMEVFQAALLWLNVEATCRMYHLQRIMSCVRFAYMEPEEILRCTTELPSLLEDPKCRERVLAAHWFSTCRKLGNPCPVVADMPSRRNFILARTTPVPVQELVGYVSTEVSPVAPSTSLASSVGAAETAFAGTSQNDPDDISTQIEQSKTTGGVDDVRSPHYNHDKPAILKSSVPRKGLEVIQTGEELDISSGGSWHVRLPSTTYSPRSSAKIALIGGMETTEDIQDEVATSMDVLDEADTTWSTYSNLPKPRYLHTAAVVAGYLYVVGGADPNVKGDDLFPLPTNTVYKLDITRNVWTQMTSMRTRRVYHKMCQVDRLLYVVGGQDENKTVLSSMEVYNPVTDSWINAAPLSSGRLGMGVAAYKGIIYVAGGYGATYDKISGQHTLSLVECFNQSQNRWSMRNSLRVPRCYGELVVANGSLYLCGGATQAFTLDTSVLTSMNTVDVYDSDHDCWYVASRLMVARHDATVVATDTSIFIFGGLNSTEDTALSSYERYDISTNIWEEKAEAMPRTCVGTTAVVISDY